MNAHHRLLLLGVGLILLAGSGCSEESTKTTAARTEKAVAKATAKESLPEVGKTVPPAPEKSEPATGAITFHKLSFDEALTKAKADKKLVMVDFYADWCGPCRMLDQKTWTDEKVKDWLRSKTVAIKVDIDDHKSLAEKYKITGIPALVFFKPDGTEAGRLVGFMPASDFLKRAEAVLNK